MNLDRELIEYAKEVLLTKDSVNVDQMQYILTSVGLIGEHEDEDFLSDYLISKGYLVEKYLIPFEKCINDGMFIMDNYTVKTAFRDVDIKSYLITPLGQLHIYNLFKKN